jgi:hypothetical protein
MCEEKDRASNAAIFLMMPYSCIISFTGQIYIIYIYTYINALDLAFLFHIKYSTNAIKIIQEAADEV